MTGVSLAKLKGGPEIYDRKKLAHKLTPLDSSFVKHDGKKRMARRAETSNAHHGSLKAASVS